MCTLLIRHTPQKAINENSVYSVKACRWLEEVRNTWEFQLHRCRGMQKVKLSFSSYDWNG